MNFSHTLHPATLHGMKILVHNAWRSYNILMCLSNNKQNEYKYNICTLYRIFRQFCITKLFKQSNDWLQFFPKNDI